MAHEVQSGAYEHTPEIVRPPETQTLSIDESMAQVFRDAKNAVRNREASRKVPVFKYNMLHDIESCYWILLWFILLHVPVHVYKDYDPAVQYQHSMDIFPEERVTISGPRIHAIKNNDFISNVMTSLHPSMTPASSGIQAIAQAIIFGHQAMQKADPIPTAIPQADFFYDGFSENVEEMIAAINNYEVEYISHFRKRRQMYMLEAQAQAQA